MSFSLEPQRGPAPAAGVGPRLRRGRGPPCGGRSGTSGRRPRGRSSRRRPRSASTRSTSSPRSASTRPGSASRSPSRSCSGVTPGIGLSIVGTGLAAAGVARATAPPEQIGEWVPQMFGTAGRRQARRVLRRPSPTPAPTSASMRTRAVYDEAKDEWVLNGTKTWITNGGIADVHVVVAVGRPRAAGPRPGHASSSRRARKGLSPGPEVQEARHPRLAHRRGRARRRAGPRARACSAARTSSTSGWPGPASGPAESAGRPPMATFEPTRPRSARMAIGIARAAVRVRPRLRQGARAVRQADHREPGDRVQARRHGAPRIDAARLLVWRAAWMARQRQAVRQAPRARCRSSWRARPRCG